MLYIITNLYWLPWEKTRATFNQELFSRLASHQACRVLVLIPIWDFVRYFRRMTRRDPHGLLLTYVPFIRIPGLPQLNGFLYWIALRIFFALHGGIKTSDTVLASWLYPDAYAAARVAAAYGAPTISVALGTDGNFLLDVKQIRPQIIQTIQRSVATVAVSEALRDRLRTATNSPERVITIYNGVDSVKFAPGSRTLARQNKSIGQSEVVLLFVGSLIETKGVFELLEVFAALKAKKVVDRLVFIGGGDSVNRLRQRASQLMVADWVTFAGKVPHEQLAEWFRIANLFCLPSYREGVPNVILEAMACGIPVVATRVGGIPEVLPPECGILVTPHDGPGLLAAVERAVDIPWSEAAIVNHARRFSWENAAVGFSKIIDEAQGRE
jgi:glycosyltransferase involved in cell wall biosynthesis